MAGLVQLLQITIPLVALCLLILIIFQPCTPPFLLSMSAKCGEIKWTHIGSTHAIVLFELWMCAQIFNGAAPTVFFVCFAGIICLLNYFQLLGASIQESRCLEQYQENIRFYRRIQILEKHMNDITNVYILPALIIGVPLLQIVSQYVSITMHDDIPMPGFVLFPIMSVEAIITNVVVFTPASWVNGRSTRILARYARKITHCVRKSVVVKERKACTMLKIKFGSNYVDQSTPLVIQNFCLNQTMSLILINTSRRTRQK